MSKTIEARIRELLNGVSKPKLQVISKKYIEKQNNMNENNKNKNLNNVKRLKDVSISERNEQEPLKDKLLIDILQNYKFDDSALLAGRKVVSYRSIGDKVNPENMTYKEYINHLCFIYNFKVGHPWDGIERKPHRPNWTPEPNFNIQNREEALKFLNIKQSKKAPDGVERRAQGQRRTGQKDVRSIKIERRVSEKQRRKEDLQNNLTYFVTMIFLLIVIISWVSYSIFLHMQEIAK